MTEINLQKNNNIVDQFRKDITFEATIRDQKLRFDSTWGLFSPREIDKGTQLLLNEIQVGQHDDCLDLGCGYGPIGITLGKLAIKGQVTMVDRDYVAIDYSNRNIKNNSLNNTKAIMSNGFTNIPNEKKFNLVASNLPAKIGNEMTSILFADTYQHLHEEGELVVVTLSGMKKYIQRSLSTLFGNYEKVRQSGQYTLHRAIRHKDE
ncbi:MAG: methyltransferase [Dehalococcoidia bacterium]|nr:methyltransferase [Dehalococcoidia bacterium]